MARYQHILLAVDFTDDSTQLIDKALELGRQNDARLTLIHVIEYTGSIYSGEIPLPEDLDIDQRLADLARKKLASLCNRHGIARENALVEIGTPKREITRVARELEADLIIIGSHGRHGLQLLLGSTANGVLHLADCDVLAVRVGAS
jgi:universal stress protein A